MKTKLFIAGIAFMAMTTLAIAQSKDQTSSKQQNSIEEGVNFVDTNNDGICDNFGSNGSNASCKGSGAGNGSGQGRKQMMGQGRGAGSCMGQNRMGTGQGQGRGMGRNFVDDDKNGVCDNFEVASKK